MKGFAVGFFLTFCCPLSGAALALWCLGCFQ
jgi:hypothetical protein